MTRLPLSLRLALRQLRRNRTSTLLAAVFLAMPTILLVVVHITAGGETWATAAAATLALPLTLGIIAMVAANLLVAARRNQQTFALLTSVGAPPATLFRVVSANGLVSGAIAGFLTVVIGVPVGWLWAGAVTPVNPVAIILLALLAVGFGWAASLVPAIISTQVDPLRVLRGIPTSVRGRWRTDRIGVALGVIGFGAMIISATATLVLRSLFAKQEQPGFWVGALGGLGAGALGQLGVILLIIGVALALPALFALIGRAFNRFGLAPRLAARDAERGWNRSVSAGIVVLVTTFAIGGYLTLAHASSSPYAHWWQLQQDQISLSLIDPGYENETINPHTVEDVSAFAEALTGNVELTEVRTLDGVQGPFYGWPVEENEGFSGRQVMSFPEEGLPYPRIAQHGICDAEKLPAWRCTTAHHYDSRYFTLNPTTPSIWVGDADDLRLMLGGTVEDTTLAAFQQGEALIFDARYLAADGSVTIDWASEKFVPEDEPEEFLPAGPPVRSESIAGHLIPLEHDVTYGVFLSHATASNLELTAQPSLLLGALAQPLLGDDLYDTTEAIALAIAAATEYPDFYAETTIETGPDTLDAEWTIGALLIAGGIALAVSLVAVGLSRIEGRETDRTLAALGADPGIRRRISAWYALIVVGVTSVLGVALAIVSSALPMTGIGSVVTAPPWVELSVLAIGVPLLAAATALLIRPAPVNRPARTSPRRLPQPR